MDSATGKGIGEHIERQLIAHGGVAVLCNLCGPLGKIYNILHAHSRCRFHRNAPCGLGRAISRQVPDHCQCRPMTVADNRGNSVWPR